MFLEPPWDSSVKMETKSNSHQSAAAAEKGEGLVGMNLFVGQLVYPIYSPSIWVTCYLRLIKTLELRPGRSKGCKVTILTA